MAKTLEKWVVDLEISVDDALEVGGRVTVSGVALYEEGDGVVRGGSTVEMDARRS